jgi:hypothetical protein
MATSPESATREKRPVKRVRTEISKPQLYYLSQLRVLCVSVVKSSSVAIVVGSIAAPLLWHLSCFSQIDPQYSYGWIVPLQALPLLLSWKRA